MSDTDIYRLETMIHAIERLNGKCEDNMKRLNNMMLELKGVIAMVRPSVKNNDWYGQQIDAEGVCYQKESVKSIELNISK